MTDTLIAPPTPTAWDLSLNSILPFPDLRVQKLLCRAIIEDFMRDHRDEHYPGIEVMVLDIVRRRGGMTTTEIELTIMHIEYLFNMNRIAASGNDNAVHVATYDALMRLRQQGSVRSLREPGERGRPCRWFLA